jgi:hypothetical protein
MVNSPIFVVGAPRSGTTLLQLIIAAHSKLFSLPETHYFTFVKQNVRINNNNSYLFSNTLFKALELKPKLIFSEYEKSNIIETIGRKRTDKNILEQIILEYKEKHSLDGNRWVEKTPRHVNHLDEIFYSWPEAKIINVFRDPRDSISSFHHLKSFKNNRENVLDIFMRIFKWKKCVSSAMEYKESIFTIRYEDLIDDTEYYTCQIMDFTGEKFEERQLTNFNKNYKTSIIKEEKHKKLTEANKIINRKAVWKERLDPDEIYWIEKLCSNEMNALRYFQSGYEISNVEKIWGIYYLNIYFFRKALVSTKLWIKKRTKYGV